MKSIDIKSVIIGILGTILVFVSIGATDKNLGDITVNSITVMDDGSGGFISTLNADGKQTSYLGTAAEGGGQLRTYNADGTQTSYLGTAEEGFGFLTTNNKHGVRVGYFGSGNSQDGLIGVFDRYGDIGWTADGKK